MAAPHLQHNLHTIHTGNEGTPLGTFPCEFRTKKVFEKSYLKLARFTLNSDTQTHTTALLSIPKRWGAGALVIV
jgi:hypothetical protein